MAGLILDPWQAWFIEQACAVKEETFHNKYTNEYQRMWAAKEVGLMVSRQNGKGPLSVTTPILTVDGWTTMGDVNPGQQVYGIDGKPVKVVASSETYTDDVCYEVEFTDGSVIIAGEDHLWRVRNKKSSESWRDMRTSELADRVGMRRRDNGRMEYNWRVKCDVQVDTPRADLPIDPYLLGYWLGDGTSVNARITVGHEDRDWVAGRVERAGAVLESWILHDHGNAWSFGFHLTDSSKWSRAGFRSRAKGLGILGTKRIPEVYLTASIDQRKQLLAGLMDSDGSIAITNRSPQAEFTTSIPGLAEDFQRLARSLGIRVTPKRGKTSLNGARKKDRTRFLWTPTFNPFQMPRKAEKWKPPTSNRHELMSIVDIRRVPTVPTRCIQVDAEDGVYLVGHNFTPTHNSILEARELAGLFLLGERTIVHSAHQFDTSKEHFLRILELLEGVPDFDREIEKVTRSHGDEGVVLKSGQRLRFRTRTKGGGRGWSPDFIAMDEAMYLGPDQIGALMPSLSARPNPQIWYTGSAGDKDSIQFGRVRNRAIRGNRIQDPITGEWNRVPDPALFFAEWSIDGCTDLCLPSCDEHDQPNSIGSFAKANPGLGIRITVEHVQMEQRSMDEETFARERLGVGDWPVEGDQWGVIDEESWRARIDETSDIAEGSVKVLAVDTSPNREFSSIAVCGSNGVFRHVEITSDEIRTDHRPGTDWVVRRVKQIWDRVRPDAVIIDKVNQAGSFIKELEFSGITVISPTTSEYAQACGEFYSGIQPRKGEEADIVHIDQLDLNTAVAGAGERILAERWAWDKRNSATDITPLVAATLAAWGYRKVVFDKPKAATPWVFFGD